ncbi:MAG: crotonase/enoyl-CoA hydratase family protein [Actinobacteria bacterium]|nr:crotonase/enoyl-CoA hydratase family protein [Actinomycetota bacterium]
MAITIETRESVSVLTLDDGNVNAMSYEFLTEALAGFNQAVAGSDAVVIAGNAKCLSAGFDLTEVIKGPEQRDAIINAGGELFFAIFTCPKPVVVACTGHAVAGGVIYLLVADSRIGRNGNVRIGFNEVSIGVPMPEFGIALSQYRLSPPRVEEVLLGDMYNPEQARDIGLLDQLIDGEPVDVVDAAVARAIELASRNADAYGQTKLAARAELIKRFA